MAKAYINLKLSANLEYPDKVTRDIEFAEIVTFLESKNIITTKAVDNYIAQADKRERFDEMRSKIDKEREKIK